MAVELAAETKATAARSRLRAFLAEAHRQMPSLPAAEIDRDIEETIAAVRSQP
jgi:hypothetical protein